MQIYKELDSFGFFEWYCMQYGGFNYQEYKSVYDDLPLDNIIRTELNACALKFFLQKHHIYAVIIPTVTMYWTFKTMTVVEGMIEVPPYNHVDANDYKSFEEAEFWAIKKLIEFIKK